MDLPMPDASVESTSPGALKRRVDRGDDVTLLDARMVNDYTNN